MAKYKRLMENIDKSKWKELISSTENSSILDVRTPAEWLEGIQKNAIRINFLAFDEFKSEIAKLPKDRTYFVYCRSGNRSGKACEYLDSLGFTSYNLVGGTLEWDEPLVETS